MPRRAVKKDFATFLVSNSGVSLSSGATSIPVVNAADAPTGGPFTIEVNATGEMIRVNGVSGNIFTPCTRGLPEGNAAATILDGSLLSERWGAQDIADVEDYVPPIDASNITSGTISSARLPATVSSLKKTGASALTGDVTLTGGTGVTLTQSGQDISIAASTGGGSGTVTSVGLSLPADFTITGSPVTGSGTLTAVRNTQSANTVFAGPATGSPASPTYRLLVAGDLPAATTSTQGAVTLANVTPTADGTGAIGSSTAAARADHVHPLVTSFTAEVTVPDLKINGLTGSTQASRQVGATASGAPVTGPHLVGDASLSLADGKWYVCTVAGTPGTFVSAAGSGTVTSVGLTVPSALLNVSGSPITGSGTLAVSLATQSANTVLAGPTTGSAATPTMRALVAADLSSVAMTLAPLPSGDTTGVTDNAALQAILSGFPAAGGVLRLQIGTYYITGLTTSVPTAIIGAGAGGIGDLSGGGKQIYPGLTTIKCPSATATAITIGAPPFVATGFDLFNNAGTTPTAGAGIAAVAAYSGDYARFIDISVHGFYINIDIRNGEGPYFSRVLNYSPVHYGLKLANATIPDAGGVALEGCQFETSTSGSTPAAFIRWESGGGFRMTNCGCTGSTVLPTTGLDIAVADGVSTSVFLIANNTFENTSTYGIRIHLSGVSNTGTLSRMAITGNEFAGGANATKAISITPEVSGKVKNISLTGNTFGDDIGTAYDLANVNHVTISGGDSQATTTLTIGSGVTNLVQASTNAVATTGADGLVKVDNTSSGDPVALTLAGYLASIAGLTHSNLDAAAGVLLSQLGQSGASTGQSPQWNGSAWVPATPSAASGTFIAMQSGSSAPPIPLWNSDGTDYVYLNS